MLIIDPHPPTRTAFTEVVRRLGLEAVHADTGPEALERFHHTAPAVVILDLGLPDMPGQQLLPHLTRGGQVAVIAITEASDLRAAVEAMRAGAADVLARRAAAHEVERAIQGALSLQLEAGEKRSPSSSGYEEIFRHSPKMRALEAVVARLAAVPMPALIRGESGVGKELIAATIHHLSDRSDRPFLKLRGTALPADRLDIELERMAEAARGGILFFAEVGEASAAAQARLLRIVSDDDVNIRVLATTSADMYRLVATGIFRGDLYERLAVATIDVPPLRERREEIDWLVQRFLERFALEFQRPVPRVSEPTAELLRTYSWPGNVRELEHIVKRWVVLGGEDHVREEIEARRAAVLRGPVATKEGSLALREVARRAAREAERVALQDALRRFRGNRAAVARHLKVSYKTLLQKLAEAGLSATAHKRTG